MIEGLDPVFISKLTSDQVEQVTCTECCKYYIAPETAGCGHTLCHSCWKGRQTCHTCAATVNKKSLKLNIPLQTLTEHVHSLGDDFEKLFNVKLDDFTLGIPDDLHTTDPTRNVKEWLASSQNQFSGPVVHSQASDQDVAPVEVTKSNIQIHSHSKKLNSPEKVVRPPQPQEDWDKIEVLPDTEDTNKNLKQCNVDSMDFEQIIFDDNEYTAGNPRRSSRKRELKSHSNPPTREASVEKNSGKNSSNHTDNRSLKTKQTWSNVKKMRKEFSKLNKKNNSKLNISIEMCKKTQKNKSNPSKELIDTEPLCLNIDDNTPDAKNKQTNLEDNSNVMKQDELKIEGTNADKYINENNQVSNKNVSKTQNKKCVELVPEKELKNVSLAESKKSENNKVNNHNTIDNESDMEKTYQLPFIRKSAMCSNTAKNKVGEDKIQISQKEMESNTIVANTDDIEISIKIGNTITNILIKNKKNDIQMKVNSDKEIQTSLGPYRLNNQQDVACSPLKNINVQHIELNIGEGNKVHVSKSLSTKKNTATADTATAQFEITDSVDKELSDVMECLESKSGKKDTKKQFQSTDGSETAAAEKENETSKENDDIDIFNSGSVKETTVKLLKDCKHLGSEIIQTLKTKKSQKKVDKRDQNEMDEVELPSSKKQRIGSVISNKEDPGITPELQAKNVNDSENMNYDVIMSQVFANIDADIQSSGTKTKENIVDLKKKIVSPAASQIIHKTQVVTKKKSITVARNTSQINEIQNQKYSENMFSLLDKDSEGHEVSGRNKKQPPIASSTQQQIDNLLTPGMCREMAVTEDNTEADKDIAIMEPQLGTPMTDHHDDSDKSVVEETPQKNLSFAKPKQTDQNKLATSTKSVPSNMQAERRNQQGMNRTSDSQIIRSIINISDTLVENSKNKDLTVVEIPKRQPTLETPLTINKFVTHITHNSTPIARKSLNFEDDNLDDPEQTLCPTTTQEKTIIAKAFERTPQSPIRRPLQLKNVSSSTKPTRNFFLAASCLTTAEVKEVKRLCLERGWMFLEKYTNDLTHLVVGVDEENRSQRSVKYMCALAASKWIVSFKWVLKCLESKTHAADEWPYEALDACGEPGPKRSRTALTKIFDGITFFCMAPFSVLDILTLKAMLTAAGGRVVDSTDGVTVTEENGFKPALLLAEPEHTQEDRFIFLAMECKLVPVNYEWALNCLGTYSLGSIHELLLCPPSLLPPETARWPEPMMRIEDDD